MCFKQCLPPLLIMHPWCQTLFIYLEGKHYSRAWLYFQKNPVSKAMTLPLIHCFQPLAAWTPESKTMLPLSLPLPSQKRTQTLLLLNAQMTFLAHGYTQQTLWKWFNCFVRSAEAHRLPISAIHLPTAKSLAVTPLQNEMRALGSV